MTSTLLSTLKQNLLSKNPRESMMNLQPYSPVEKFTWTLGFCCKTYNQSRFQVLPSLVTTSQTDISTHIFMVKKVLLNCIRRIVPHFVGEHWHDLTSMRKTYSSLCHVHFIWGHGHCCGDNIQRAEVYAPNENQVASYFLVIITATTQHVAIKPSCFQSQGL